MWKSTNRLSSAAGSLLILVGSIIAVPQAAIAGSVEDGKKIAENRKKGNCFACHDYPGAVLPGNIGPKLENMKARYPDKAKLRARIHDETKFNPNTIMPPFGKHKILSKDEVDAVTDWAHTL